MKAVFLPALIYAAVQASDPTPQTQVAAGPASVTFSAPSGGQPPYSYSATLIKPDSSTEALADAGLGPYLFTTVQTGIYRVVLTITDSRGIPTTATGVVSLVKDYLPGAAPARQDLSSGTTTANVDFPYATGQTTASVGASLDTPGGGSIGTITDTGTAWRVPLSGLGNGKGYKVTLQYTASDGQICYQSAEVTVAAAAGAVDWLTVLDIDCTQVETQTGMDTDGSYTVRFDGVSILGTPTDNVDITMVVSHTSAQDPADNALTTLVATNGVGIVANIVATVTGGNQNKLISFRLDNIAGLSDLKPDKNLIVLECVYTQTTMGANQDVVSFELHTTTPLTSNDPAMFAQVYRSTSINYLLRAGRRAGASASSSSGQTIATSLPATFDLQVIGRGAGWEVGGSASSSYVAPYSATLKGNPGFPSTSPADSAPAYWAATQYAAFLATVNGASDVNNFTLSRLRVLMSQPRQ